MKLSANSIKREAKLNMLLGKEIIITIIKISTNIPIRIKHKIISICVSVTEDGSNSGHLARGGHHMHLGR